MVNRRIGFSTLLVAADLYSGFVHPHCGGEERWPVKVGNDPAAGKVRMDNPISSKIETLLKIPTPIIPKDETTRTREEMSVYVVQGRLVKFKLETGKTGDMDYHLVVSDDTLKYTDDKAGQKPGHSIIAEIPDPNCFAGREGQGANDSVFKDLIVQARTQLEARFPKISKSKWNDAEGVPVEITGVAFFDKPHG